MKHQFLFILLIALAVSTKAQSFDYDCIGRDQFYLLPSGTNYKSTAAIKAAEIKSVKTAEQLYGVDHTSKPIKGEATKANYNQITYDGLELMISEDGKAHSFFHVKNNKYKMVLADGKTIQVGMKASALKAMFPKSYSKITTTTDANKKGKIGLVVYVSKTVGNKTIPEDATIIFVLDKADGKLMEFYYHEPS